MENFNSLYEELEDEKSNYEPIPTGTYVCKINSCAYNVLESPEQINWEFEIIEGDFKTRRLWRNSRLDENGVKWALKDFLVFGIKLNSPDDWPHACEEVISRNATVEVYVKVNPNPNNPDKPYTNPYLNSVITSGKDESFEDDIQI